VLGAGLPQLRMKILWNLQYYTDIGHSYEATCIMLARRSISARTWRFSPWRK
jgi:hypothetical protein